MPCALSTTWFASAALTTTARRTSCIRPGNWQTSVVYRAVPVTCFCVILFRLQAVVFNLITRMPIGTMLRKTEDMPPIYINLEATEK